MKEKYRQNTAKSERGGGISEELVKRTFAAVKADDTKSFSECAETAGVLSLRIGRFPLLPLMYLYGSRRLIKLYGTRLAGLSVYTFAPEEGEAYAAFRAKAGKALRLYMSDDALVTPSEMLLILGRTDIFPEVYAASPKSASVDNNLSEIRLLLYGIEREKGEKGFKPPKPALSGAQKRYIMISIIACALILILSGALGIISILSPEGSAEKPFEIDNAESLKLALGGDAYYKLTDDIHISEWEPTAFRGKLDGDGHTLTFDGQAAHKGFLKELTGKISNLTVVFNDFEAELTEQKGFFAEKNSGIISGVEVTLTADITVSETVEHEETDGGQKTDAELEAADISGTFFVTAGVLENRGTISDCRFELHLSARGEYKANACFGGIVGVNYSAVSDCLLTDNSAVAADTIDAGGIAARNATGGVISGSSNGGAFVQTSSSPYWNPNTGGIAAINYGKITKSENKGVVSSTATNTEHAEENANETIAGGIASINKGLIDWSKNNGAVSASAENSYVYAGGVAGFNSATAELYKCCSYGQIAVNLAETELIGVGGGLAGYNAGYIQYCYSLSPLGGEGASFGGIAGAADYATYYYTVINADSYYVENYYIIQNSIEYGIGKIFTAEGTFGTECGTAGVGTLDELKSKEVYWG